MHRTRPTHLIKLAREFRKEATYTENLLWQALRKHKQSGLKFRRQHPIIGFIADLYCAEHKLIVELDGDVHDNKEVIERNAKRQAALENAGYRVLRFRNEEVTMDIDDVISSILVVCGKPPLPRTPSPPTPLPKLGERGV